MSGGVSTDFKSSNRIEISRLVQMLLNFEWFQGSPQGWGVGGWGWGWWEGAPYPCVHACACTHMHAHAYDIIGNSQVFPQWGWPFAWNYHVYHVCMCMHVHVCMCVHVHVFVGHPPTTPPTPIHPPLTPTAAGSPKHQNSISLELIEIIQFCLKILYLWTFLNSYRLKLITQNPPPTCPIPPESRKLKLEELQ